MIKITINKSADIYQFKVNGHAAFAKYGQDIVCAAVSTALIMTGNLLLKYKDGYNIIELESKEGLFNLKVKNDDGGFDGITKGLGYAEVIVDVNLIIHIVPEDESLFEVIENGLKRPSVYPALGRHEDILGDYEEEIIKLISGWN